MLFRFAKFQERLLVTCKALWNLTCFSKFELFTVWSSAFRFEAKLIHHHSKNNFLNQWKKLNPWKKSRKKCQSNHFLPEEGQRPRKSPSKREERIGFTTRSATGSKHLPDRRNLLRHRSHQNLQSRPRWIGPSFHLVLQVTLCHLRRASTFLVRRNRDRWKRGTTSTCRKVKPHEFPWARRRTRIQAVVRAKRRRKGSDSRGEGIQPTIAMAMTATRPILPTNLKSGLLGDTITKWRWKITHVRFSRCVRWSPSRRAST